MTKRLLCLCLMSLFSVAAFAQTNTNALVWLTDLDAARKLAKETNRPIYVYMTDGSRDCLAIEKELLDSPLFKRFAQDNFVLFRLDVPKVPKSDIPKRVDVMLSRVRRTYPGMIMVNDKEKWLSTVTYKKIPNKTPKPISDYLFELKDIMEKKGYTVDATALEKHSPPGLKQPTRSGSPATRPVK